MATTYPVPLAGQRITASLLTSMLPLQVVKAAAETVNNSGTYQNDNELVLPVSASATYLLDMFLIYQSANAADITMQWSVPAGATMHWGMLGIDTATASTIGSWSAIHRTETEVAAAGSTGTTTPMIATPKGILVVAGTAGNLQLQWAQLVATASNTQVLAGSWMKLTRVA